VQATYQRFAFTHQLTDQILDAQLKASHLIRLSGPQQGILLP
jgi:hypothetical protein